MDIRMILKNKPRKRVKDNWNNEGVYDAPFDFTSTYGTILE